MTGLIQLCTNTPENANKYVIEYACDKMDVHRYPFGDNFTYQVHRFPDILRITDIVFETDVCFNFDDFYNIINNSYFNIMFGGNNVYTTSLRFLFDNNPHEYHLLDKPTFIIKIQPNNIFKILLIALQYQDVELFVRFDNFNITNVKIGIEQIFYESEHRRLIIQYPHLMNFRENTIRYINSLKPFDKLSLRVINKQLKFGFTIKHSIDNIEYIYKIEKNNIVRLNFYEDNNLVYIVDNNNDNNIVRLDFYYDINLVYIYDISDKPDNDHDYDHYDIIIKFKKQIDSLVIYSENINIIKVMHGIGDKPRHYDLSDNIKLNHKVKSIDCGHIIKYLIID